MVVCRFAFTSSPRTPNFSVGGSCYFVFRFVSGSCSTLQLGEWGDQFGFLTLRKCCNICFVYRGRSNHKSNEIPFHGKVFLGCLLQLHSRSIFGAVTIYHCLPHHAVDRHIMSAFRTKLTKRVRFNFQFGDTYWHKFFNGRRTCCE